MRLKYALRLDTQVNARIKIGRSSARNDNGWSLFALLFGGFALAILLRASDSASDSDSNENKGAKDEDRP